MSQDTEQPTEPHEGHTLNLTILDNADDDADFLIDASFIISNASTKAIISAFRNTFYEFKSKFEEALKSSEPTASTDPPVIDLGI